MGGAGGSTSRSQGPWGRCPAVPPPPRPRVTRRRVSPQVTSRFELYGCFSPLVTKAGAIGGLTKLLRWLKREEEWLFIRYPPPFCAAPARPQAAEG